MLDIIWEPVKTNDETPITTERAKVLGGWLVRCYNAEHADAWGHEHGLGIGMAMVYLPDPTHSWPLKTHMFND
jgi:hypothetical protein